MGKRQLDDVISSLSRETTWRSLPRLLLLLQGLRVDCARAPPWRAACPSQAGLVGGALWPKHGRPASNRGWATRRRRAHVQVSVWAQRWPVTVIEEKLKRPSSPPSSNGAAPRLQLWSSALRCVPDKCSVKGWPVNGGYKCELLICWKKTSPFYLLLLHLNRLLRLHPLLPCKRFLVSHILLSISAACTAKNLSGPKLERVKKLLVPTTPLPVLVESPWRGGAGGWLVRSQSQSQSTTKAR